MPITQPDRKWETRKNKLQLVLDNFSKKSPVFQVLWVEDRGDELRALVLFDTPTLVKQPGKDVELAGPVLAGIRYHQRFQSVAPAPWEIVTILKPAFVFHPNVNEVGSLCLGHPTANISLEQILHTTWAGLTLNTRLVTTEDWNVFNRAAAAYVRAQRDRFPLTPRGLLEQVEPKEVNR